MSLGSSWSAFASSCWSCSRTLLRPKGGTGERISLEILSARRQPSMSFRFESSGVLFSMKRTLRCMKNEAGLRPIKRAFGTRRTLSALRFIFAKQMHHASVASASYRRRRCFIKYLKPLTSGGLFVFLGVENILFSPLHLFLNLLDLNLRLYGGILSLYCSYGIIFLM